MQARIDNWSKERNVANGAGKKFHNTHGYNQFSGIGFQGSNIERIGLHCRENPHEESVLLSG
jgi:hypothetical protein